MDAKADGKNPVQGGEEKGGKHASKEDNAGNMLTRLFKAGSETISGTQRLRLADGR